MNTQQLKELRNALSCWQDDYDRDDDKEQYDMFGAAIDAVSRLEKAERELDEFKALAEGQSELAGRNADRAQKAEAEIARRDAAASKPVALISERNLKILGKAFSVVVKHEPVMVRPIALYTAAPAASVPDEMNPEMMRAVQLKSELGAYAAANLAGAYGLFDEFWQVALSASRAPGGDGG